MSQEVEASNGTSFAELMDTRAARPFSFSFNTSDYRILLMDQDQGRLYLGSREYLVALDMHNVNKEPLIVCMHAHKHTHTDSGDLFISVFV